MPCASDQRCQGGADLIERVYGARIFSELQRTLDLIKSIGVNACEVSLHVQIDVCLLKS